MPSGAREISLRWGEPRAAPQPAPTPRFPLSASPNASQVWRGWRRPLQSEMCTFQKLGGPVCCLVGAFRVHNSPSAKRSSGGFIGQVSWPKRCSLSDSQGVETDGEGSCPPNSGKAVPWGSCEFRPPRIHSYSDKDLRLKAPQTDNSRQRAQGFGSVAKSSPHGLKFIFTCLPLDFCERRTWTVDFRGLHLALGPERDIGRFASLRRAHSWLRPDHVQPVFCFFFLF